MTTPMTTEEIAVAVVEMRLAGVHPHWILWFTRGQHSQRADIRYVLQTALTGDDKVYTKPPLGIAGGEVAEFLRTTLKEK